MSSGETLRERPAMDVRMETRPLGARRPAMRHRSSHPAEAATGRMSVPLPRRGESCHLPVIAAETGVAQAVTEWAKAAIEHLRR